MIEKRGSDVDNESLIFDLVSWVSKEPRPYQEVMDAWRTSCPRLTIWEDSVDLGFVRRTLDTDNMFMVEITEKGSDFLRRFE